MAEWEKRKIPASDKALRSLYMTASYTENLKKGKGKKIKWEREEKRGPKDEYDVPTSLTSEYTYEKSSCKESKSGTPSIKGSKKQVLKPTHPGTTAPTETVKTDEQHQSLKTKGGGYDTVRIKKVKKDIDSPVRGYEKFNRRRGKQSITQEIQDKKGKITEKTDLIAKKKKLLKLMPDAKKEEKERIQKQLKHSYGNLLTPDDLNLRKKFNPQKEKKKKKIRSFKPKKPVTGMLEAQGY